MRLMVYADGDNRNKIKRPAMLGRILSKEK
jgi:hypothetical protein